MEWRVGHYMLDTLSEKQPMTAFSSSLDESLAKRQKLLGDIFNYTRKQPQQPQIYTSNSYLPQNVVDYLHFR